MFELVEITYTSYLQGLSSLNHRIVQLKCQALLYDRLTHIAAAHSPPGLTIGNEMNLYPSQSPN